MSRDWCTTGRGSSRPVTRRSRAELCRIAEETFGWTQLRPEQLEAMEPVTDGRDVLAVLPTGAGKSAIYQVPALLLDGPTVVVSPLIALQRDQREGLAGTDAPDAVVINSAQRAAQTRRAWDKLRDGTAEYVFLSPEQLANDEIVDTLRAAGVSLFVVDEAHCVSEWGHDFRPEYLRLGTVIERLGHPPVVTLTATAAPPTRDDIVARLGLRDPAQVVASFDRPNLHLTAHLFHDDDMRRAEVVERAVELSAAQRNRPGLLRDAQGHRRLCRRAARPGHPRGGLPRGDEGRRPRRRPRAVPRRRPGRGRRDVRLRDGHRQTGRPLRAARRLPGLAGLLLPGDRPGRPRRRAGRGDAAAPRVGPEPAAVPDLPAAEARRAAGRPGRARRPASRSPRRSSGPERGWARRG